jgi:hypothetical protein
MTSESGGRPPRGVGPTQKSEAEDAGQQYESPTEGVSPTQKNEGEDAGRQYEPPPIVGRTRINEAEDAGQRYKAPPSAQVEADAITQAPDILDGVPAPLLQARAAVENYLAQASAEAAETISPQDFSGMGNIQGVGVGFSDADMDIGAPPGSPCLVLYVAEPASRTQVESFVAEALGVSAEEVKREEYGTRAVPVGIVDMQPHRFRAARPVPAGISVGHFRITAGTIGCLVTGRSAPRDNRLLMLSNNHILADVNNATFGDAIIQPGPADAGSSPADQVAILDRFVDINFNGPNWVDCATGWCWPDRVRREHVYLNGGQQDYYLTGSQPVAPVLDMAVTKSGRTTQVTSGRITGIAVTVRVNYNGRVANFQDQIAITGTSGFFSLGGDSGSLVVKRDNNRQPVGLLFAGGGGTTFANRIDRVLDALDIKLIA